MPLPYGGVQKPRERPNPVLEAQLAPITRIVGGGTGTGVAVTTTTPGVPTESVSVVRKIADQINTTTTFANLTDLVFPLEADTDYIAHFCVVLRAGIVTTGYKLTITAPGSLRLLSFTGYLPVADDATSAEKQCYRFASGVAMISTTLGTINSDYIAHIVVIISTGATPGDLQVQGASNTSTEGVTFREGSLGFLKVLAA